jgi:thioredoxin 1
MFLSKRDFFLCSVGMCFGTNVAQSSTSTVYSNATFDAAQKSGKPILLHFWAGWCPTCLSQESTINKLKATQKFSNVVVLSVNVDSQSDVMRRFGVYTRSILVAFKGRTETGREGGIISVSAIEALMSTAL